MEPTPAALEQPPAEARPRAERSLARAGIVTVAATGLTLSVNLVTGVLVARVLGPDGRGALTAVLAAPPIIAWIFEMGCVAAATYHQARRPADAPRLVSTWLLLCVPLAVVGTVVGELLLPHLLAAQSHHTLVIARLLMLTLLVMFVGDLMNGVVLGDRDFGFYNAVRVVQPLTVGLVYGVLWLLGALTVSAAVGVTAGVTALATTALGVRVIGRHGMGRPSLDIARRTLWYGVRAHSQSTAGLVNTRLDVMILPAFVGAASVGLYSVATSISLMVAGLAGSLVTIVFPTAAARGRDGRFTVVKSLYATLAIAVFFAGSLAIAADFAVRVVYGRDFAGSVGPLRILLVGAVLYAGAGVACSGLNALERPFTAALAQLVAAAVTVAGLTLFLANGGIEAAAIVSTVAYGMVFVLSLALYRRAARLAWRELVPAPSVMAGWMRQATRGAMGRA
ncbi:MAG TPA: oligosaccharide flippase family protein [Gaiellaceae bacterium]|nr:oligosaccharide flippase family protein [Gaiellaceae bacterium]